MFKREHHQKIDRLLRMLNARFLQDTNCFFGGGTAISLLLGEYRESIDVDFLCADQAGYRQLRSSVFDHDLGDLFSIPPTLLRDVRADQYGIRAVLLIDAIPIKFEIVRESRIALSGMIDATLPVPVLNREDMFAEKLLANADRFADKSVLSRDVIDIAMMEINWGTIPASAWIKTEDAYGKSVKTSFNKAKEILRTDRTYFSRCMTTMGIAVDDENRIRRALGMRRK
ncbi:hypothetical protein IMCC9480_401 [Oxalobacteraceae bacterium IMCC9480]|nr:hypothetical protein IMCC9480_401 [Oxalobacteraceae bacterium IMCC9480]NDP57792.1 nucleotidyl transferase AbiEii/AbiGii toxin family protein [Oxalobacteraceae bacterium]